MNKNLPIKIQILYDISHVINIDDNNIYTDLKGYLDSYLENEMNYLSPCDISTTLNKVTQILYQENYYEMFENQGVIKKTNYYEINFPEYRQTYIEYLDKNYLEGLIINITDSNRNITTIDHTYKYDKFYKLEMELKNLGNIIIKERQLDKVDYRKFRTIYLGVDGNTITINNPHSKPIVKLVDSITDTRSYYYIYKNGNEYGILDSNENKDDNYIIFEVNKTSLKDFYNSVIFPNHWTNFTEVETKDYVDIIFGFKGSSSTKRKESHTVT